METAKIARHALSIVARPGGAFKIAPSETGASVQTSWPIRRDHRILIASATQPLAPLFVILLVDLATGIALIQDSLC